MALLVGALLVALLVVGPAAITGQPLLLVAGLLLGTAVLLVSRLRNARDPR